MKRATVSVKRVTGASDQRQSDGGNDLKLAGKTLARFFNSEEPGNIEPVYMLEKVKIKTMPNGKCIILAWATNGSDRRYLRIFAVKW